MIKIKNCNINDLSEIAKEKEVYCFGGGKQADGFFRKYNSLHFEKYIKGFIDNDTRKAGSEIVINDRPKKIFSFSQFLEMRKEDTVVLTTSMYCYHMIEQMDREPLLDGLECYVDFFVEESYAPQSFVKTCGEKNRIPKVIHYCWFGGKPIPEELQRYMYSWKKYCPDYQIICWNERNYDINRSRYMRQAYDAGKWAFVSDYARLDIICEHGGIYLDTDVELLRSLDDLLFDDMYCGFEQNNYINFGLGYGAVSGHPILKSLLERYQSMDFVNENGEYNQTACAVYHLEEMQKYGFEVRDVYQNRDGVALYPSEVFAPINLMGNEKHITENTYSIHHYSSTWWDESAAVSMEQLRTNLEKYKERINR